MTIIGKLITPDARPRPRKVRKPGMDAYHAIAEMAGGLRHYQDVPLRLQRQWISSFLTIVVTLSLVAGLYLNVTARTAIAGREIQNLEAEIVSNERINADLQTDIATQLSNNTLEQRAQAAGFAHLERTDLEYLVVPGYFPSQGVKMVAPISDPDVLAMSPEFSESLFSWLARQMESASSPLAQIRKP
jgi:hypothetical protein